MQILGVSPLFLKLQNSNPHIHTVVLGGSGRVVNSLDFCPASLKSIGCFYFRCILSSHAGDSEFVNFTLPTLKTFLEAHS